MLIPLMAENFVTQQMLVNAQYMGGLCLMLEALFTAQISKKSPLTCPLGFVII